MRSVSGQSGVTNENECLQSCACAEERIYSSTSQHTVRDSKAGDAARFVTCMCMGSRTLLYAGEKGVEVGGHIEEHPK